MCVGRWPRGEQGETQPAEGAATGATRGAASVVLGHPLGGDGHVPGPDPRRAQVELPVEGEGGVDQREVRERLREVADLLAGERDLLGVETHVVGVGQHLLEDHPGPVELTGAGERVDVGERAQREGALGAAQTVGRGGGVVAVDQAVGDQLLVHRAQGREPHRVLRGDEAERSTSAAGRSPARRSRSAARRPAGWGSSRGPSPGGRSRRARAASAPPGRGGRARPPGGCRGPGRPSSSAGRR